jgi:hypothetical protein
MTQAILLTEEQKNQLVGQQFSSDSYFNPIQDIEGNWIISSHEITYCTNEDLIWVKNLPLIEYKAKPINFKKPNFNKI